MDLIEPIIQGFYKTLVCSQDHNVFVFVFSYMINFRPLANLSVTV